jgi:hypothetical protein
MNAPGFDKTSETTLVNRIRIYGFVSLLACVALLPAAMPEAEAPVKVVPIARPVINHVVATMEKSTWLDPFTLGHAQAIVPQQNPPEPRNVDYWVGMALQFVLAYKVHKEFGEYDLPYIRFVQWNGTPQERLPDSRLVFAWWLNQMSFEPAYAFPKDVPGAEGMLQWVDLRDYRWNPAAWQAVAERDPYTTTPPVFFAKAESLRRALGIEISKGQVKQDRYPVIAVVSAPWLFRETIESDRSTSYYDLLFARQRFTGGYGPKFIVVTETYEERITVDHKGGDYTYPDGSIARNVPPGQYVVSVPKTRTIEKKADGQAAKFVDFPRNLAEWESAFGIDVVRAFGKKADVQFEYGAVTEGGADDPRKGSIVALHNRFLLTTPTPFGAAMQSFDVFKTEDDRDYVEQSPILPFSIGTKGIKFDAGELLAYLPNGGQASFLIDANGNRQEIAANKAASDQSADKRLNAGVRNPGSCVICHGPSNGYILPRNLIDEYLKAGVDVKFRDKEKANRYRAFFLEWENRVKAFQTPYADLLRKTTQPQLDLIARVQQKVSGQPGPKGWDGSKLVLVFQAMRDYYDDMVTPAQAAAELGVPLGTLQSLATLSPRGRTGALVQGISIPRSVFERNVYRELSLLLDATRGK